MSDFDCEECRVDPCECQMPDRIRARLNTAEAGLEHLRRNYIELQSNRDAVARERDELQRLAQCHVDEVNELVADRDSLRSKLTNLEAENGRLREEARDEYKRRLDAADAAIIQAVDAVLQGGKAIDAPLDISAEWARVIRAIRINIVSRERAEASRDECRGLYAEALKQRDVARAALAEAYASLAATHNELERWRHGNTIEGDFVCPNELALTNLLQAAQAMLHAWKDVPAAHLYQRDARNEFAAAIDHALSAGKEGGE